MAHLVGDSEHGFEIVLLVEQNIGVRARASGGVRAAALAAVLVHVYPAAAEARFEQLGIVLAEDAQGFEDGLLRLVIADRDGSIRYDRGVHIVHMQLIHAEELLAQCDIAVHLVHVIVDSVDEVEVYALRNLGRVERRGKGRGIFPRIGKEAKLLKLRVKRRGNGVFELVIALIAVFKGALAEHSVRALHERHKRPGRERVRLTLSVDRVIKAQVGISQCAADRVRRVGHLPGSGEQALLGGGKDMLRAAAQAVQVAAVGLKLRALAVEGIERLFGDGDELRCRKGRRARDRDAAADALAAHVLIAGVRRVLIRLAPSVAHQLFKAHGDLVVQLHILQQPRGALAERALVPCKLLRHLHQGFIFAQPVLIGFEYICQIPCELHGDLVSFRDSFSSHRHLQEQNLCKVIITQPPRLCKQRTFKEYTNIL